MLAVAILAVLGAISVAAYNGYMSEANINKAIQEMRMISLVLDDMATTSVLPDSLADIGAQADDTWGNPYQYLRIAGAGPGVGGLRKDRSLVPLNSDYDLYSAGPDGESRAPLTAAASHDDIIRANNGAFFGVAKDY